MSTNYSPKVKFYGDDGECEGQLVWHNTSSIVVWMVDGIEVCSFEFAELKALQLAAAAESYGPGGKDQPMTAAQREEITDALPYIGGFRSAKRKP